MKGVAQFVEKNFKSRDMTFENCLHAIVYAFKLLEKDKIYSRTKILSETTRVRGKNAKFVQLEDYLRNDLVKNFVEPNLKEFNLQNYLFILGVDEISDNIRTGILDIKVCSPSFNGNVYYIFECKRFNKSLIKGYLNDGVKRFVTSQYYPNNNAPLAGMISFLESTELKNKIRIQNAFTELDSAINTSKKQLGLIRKLSTHKLSCKKYQVVTDYKYIFTSKHTRNKIKIDIELFHIMLDYNHLIND